MLRQFDFAIEGDKVDGIQPGLVFDVFALCQQIRVMVAQIHRSQCSDGAQCCDGARQLVRGDAHAHAALNDREQRFALDQQGIKAMVEHGAAFGEKIKSRESAGFAPRNS